MAHFRNGSPTLFAVDVAAPRGYAAGFFKSGSGESSVRSKNATQLKLQLGGSNPRSVLGPVPFPLSEPGPYYTGKRTYTFEDPSRDGRKIGIAVLYPALLPEGSQGTKLLAGANRDPDLSGAPYPLILTGPGSGDDLFKAHLATHGFVMVIVRFPVRFDYPDVHTVDDPRDLLSSWIRSRPSRWKDWKGSSTPIT
jgi:hypothetical protein